MSSGAISQSSSAATTSSNETSPSMSTSDDHGQKQPEWKDCTACRLTGAATFTGIGSYAIYQGYDQGAFAKVRPRGAPRSAQFTVAIGIVMIGLGLGRLVV
ncbi:hypothetical protein BD324DRAFT_652734 [Kockovaella imperatae]|uniref:Distal membrane-arm assembly complex protein 1-like domain-containing protein n=1 Tax=Kockovaella imperatae TaxID=4999 RepID=A0A1Y1UBV0_9TREE|nr:hypothetical protein BD324DRAFT_652734 [Kockovaella imperatae]ORX35014.1 hypothetical protein BD324DRAFT_652734 [Kockovaella imperatae]